MYVSFGIKEDASFLDDTWVLKLGESTWSCMYGTGPGCTRGVQPRHGPGAVAFPSVAGVGLYKMVFGGFRTERKPCIGLAGKFFNELNGRNDMFALNLATYSWEKVNLQGQAPPRRALAAMAVLERQVGMIKPLFLIAGGSPDCLSTSPPKCKMPQPLDDIWVMDAAMNDMNNSSGKPGPREMMASFDGIDDIITTKLPVWCSRVTSMSVFAVDFWMFYASTSPARTILVDAYSGDSSMMRWDLSMNENNEPFVTMVLKPGKVHPVICNTAAKKHALDRYFFM